MPERDVRKILILRFSSLGDIVMTTPMIRALRQRFPQAQIDMVVREDFFDLIRNNPHLDRKIGLSKKEGLKGLRRLRKQLNRENYDLIYDAHRSLRTAALMPLLQAPYKRYFKKHYVRRNLTLALKVPLWKDRTRFLERYIEPLSDLGVRYDGQGPEIHLDESTTKRALEIIPLPRKEAGQFRIGLVPSAQWEGKRWPLAHFRWLMESLIRTTSHTLVLFGGPADSFCEDLCRGLPQDRVLNTQGKLKILESAAVLNECDFVIANDTGLMHLADALGKPAVLFLGPTSAEMGCLPYHPKSLVLEKDLWCRPCSKNGQAPCIRKRRYCLELITPDEALDAARAVMASAFGKEALS